MMKLSEVEDYGYVPDNLDLTNFFDVEEKTATNGSVETFFNLNDGVTIEGVEDIVSDSASIKRYRCKSGDNLRFISFREYGSIHYWWMIAKINGIYDAFEELEGGREIFLLSREHMNYIMNMILGKRSTNA